MKCIVALAVIFEIALLQPTFQLRGFSEAQDVQDQQTWAVILLEQAERTLREERHPLRFAHGALVIVELVKPIEPERANRLVRAAARALAEVDFETPEARMMRLKQRVAIRNPYEVDFLWEKLLEHGADLDVELLKGSLERLKASEQWKANVLTNIARSLIARSSGSSENERKNQRAEQAEHEIRGDPLAG